VAIPDLTPNIQTTATGPAEAEGDGQRVKAQPVDAQIQADRYIAAKAARGKTLGGVIFGKIIPAACPADQQGTNAGGSGEFDQPSI